MSQLNEARNAVDSLRANVSLFLALHPELNEDEILRSDMLEGCTTIFETIDRLLEYERETEALVEATTEQEIKLARRRTRFEARQKTLRTFLMKVMGYADLRKAERPAATVSIAAGRPKVMITDENELPEQFIRTRREPNKEEIGKALKEGQTVPGATLSNAEPVLRIS